VTFLAPNWEEYRRQKDGLRDEIDDGAQEEGGDLVQDMVANRPRTPRDHQQRTLFSGCR
jgi:hypothetical protein